MIAHAAETPAHHVILGPLSAGTRSDHLTPALILHPNSSFSFIDKGIPNNRLA